MLTTITIEPQNSQPATHSVIWLHGLGADGNDFTPIVPELRLPAIFNVRFIFPHAPIRPVTLNNGYAMRAWFDIYGLNRHAKIDEAGIAKTVGMINDLIEDEISRGINTKNIMLAGFSQGAAIALTVGLSYHKPLGGILGLSGYLPLGEQIVKKAHNDYKANASIPIFLAHGTEDTVLPYQYGEITKDVLQSGGYSVAWHSYAMPHTVCAEEVKDIAEWIKKIWGI